MTQHLLQGRQENWNLTHFLTSSFPRASHGYLLPR